MAMLVLQGGMRICGPHVMFNSNRFVAQEGASPILPIFPVRNFGFPDGVFDGFLLRMVHRPLCYPIASG